MGQYVSEVTDQTCICSSLSVVENSSGRKRLVVNLWHLNQFCRNRGLSIGLVHCHDAVGRSKCYVFTVCLSAYQWPHAHWFIVKGVIVWKLYCIWMRA